MHLCIAVCTLYREHTVFILPVLTRMAAICSVEMQLVKLKSYCKFLILSIAIADTLIFSYVALYNRYI